VDVNTFADYRTEYFKGGKPVKVIDRDWVSMGLDDPRAQYWNYWYAKDLVTGHETMVSTHASLVDWNREEAPSSPTGDFWSTDTLRVLAESP
jgi:hypothetical protein